MNPEPALSRDILSYFVRNPQAVDSLEGIARWRLLDEGVHRGVRATHEALLWLVERGVLRRSRGPGQEPVFLLDSSRIKEAQQLLVELRARSRSDERTEK